MDRGPSSNHISSVTVVDENFLASCDLTPSLAGLTSTEQWMDVPDGGRRCCSTYQGGVRLLAAHQRAMPPRVAHCLSMASFTCREAWSYPGRCPSSPVALAAEIFAPRGRHRGRGHLLGLITTVSDLVAHLLQPYSSGRLLRTDRSSATTRRDRATWLKIDSPFVAGAHEWGRLRGGPVWRQRPRRGVLIAHLLSGLSPAVAASLSTRW